MQVLTEAERVLLKEGRQSMNEAMKELRKAELRVGTKGGELGIVAAVVYHDKAAQALPGYGDGKSKGVLGLVWSAGVMDLIRLDTQVPYTLQGYLDHKKLSPP